jgi:hypothetical protein
MKKYLIIFSLFLFSCSSKRRTPAYYTFDASKDTSFVVNQTSGMSLRVEFDVKGEIEDSSMLIITYYQSKLNANSKFEVLLSPGTVNLENKVTDFYEGDALFTFKHLNNKKGKLTIKASL